MLLALSGCGVETITPYPADGVESVMLATPAGSVPVACESCAQATLSALQTQEKNSADFQAAATAEILRVNAQATVNSANATLNAAQTQEQNNTNIIAAQLAATAEIVRANAQATLNSASSTQIAAMTQGQYNLQVTESARTQEAAALLIQQNKNDLAAGTQTAVANNIATQTQSAAATSQWYADQERQRNEERQGPISFIWTWCLPIFLVLLAGLILWGGRRWLSIQQANQKILAQPAEKLPEPVAVVRQHRRSDDRLPYIESDVLDDGYQVTTPHDQVSDWLDEVKDELQSSDEKDKDDDQGN
jgi:hypothetical protein